MKRGLLCSMVFLWLASCAIRDVDEPWMRAQGATSGDEIDSGPYEGRRPLQVIRGKASYYANSLAGNRTASGERYHPRKLTAASRNLPFGTIVRVVREDNGRSVIVRINDRGPFGRRARILDLSRAAAEQLDMIRKGVVQVRAEILERGGKAK
jgi:rare lipoprotein A